MSDQQKTCELCGEPMSPGEEMFKYHGYSGPCPKLPKEKPDAVRELSDRDLDVFKAEIERRAALSQS